MCAPDNCNEHDETNETEEGSEGSAAGTSNALIPGQGTWIAPRILRLELKSDQEPDAIATADWVVDDDKILDLPAGYRMLRRGGQYIVVDDEGEVIAGPSRDLVDLHNQAWTHYKTKYGY
jgi:hypothetical protein